MKNDWYNLGWLREAPEDFSARCKELPSGDVAALRALTNYQLNDNQLRKIAKIKSGFDKAPKGFDALKLVVMSNANSEFMHGALEASGIRHGLWLNVFEEHMGQTVMAVLNPESHARSQDMDIVLLALTYHAFLAVPPGDAEAAQNAVEQAMGEVHMMAETLKDNNGAALLVQTVPLPPVAVFGSLDQRLAGTLRQVVSAYNDEIRRSKIPFIDVAATAEMVGLSIWHDAGLWHWTKLPFAQTLLPLYAEHVGRTIGAIRGKSKKCLVLDLDNTLWGGVIGDDGVEGIALGQNSPKGEAYIALQQYILDLKKRGVVLAVCSKNEEKNARLPFQKHPDMVLKEDDIAVFVANWNDKAGNIQAIAEALDLTADSFVFLDDNPAEREILRRDVPMVAVPEIPNHDPTLYPLLLSAAGYFEAVLFTSNDTERAEQYAANAKRSALKTGARDITEYLKSLEMDLEINGFRAEDVARVSQLINRSNQFNLTTIRYTEDEVAKVEADPKFACFSFRLKDKFGDNGIIAILICEERGEDWYINTWLMSCRVLQRKVEHAVLNTIAGAAQKAGKKGLIGHYIPTAKNEMVRDHYKNYGFTITEEKGEGETLWRLDLAAFKPEDVPMALSGDLAKTLQKAA
ncbi:MAG: HAD-IIIC family phosphatase [Alphaproteobacteria bacterium]|nr:HAD-IIIC family phosphatase [Alphaproteobacteria bacterium]